jgi:hypothetical protein
MNKFTLSKTNPLYSKLDHIDNSVFKLCGLELSKVEVELESQNYSAHRFQLNGRNVVFRTAKITPTKIGQFVTIWKRNKSGITVPFDISDNVDLYIIATRKANNFGLFIFPKSILYEFKVLSGNASDGKRGMRVYPAWDMPTSKQALKSKDWQAKYFLDLSEEKKTDMETAKRLL